MAFANWTFVSDDVNVTASLDSATPLQGIASLRVNMPVNAAANWIFYYTAGLVKDCVNLKVLLRQSGGGNFHSIGMFAQMQTAGALANSAYFTVMHNDFYGAAAGRITINKNDVNGALTDNAGSAHADAQFPASAAVVALGLRCEHDTVSGNVLVTAYYDPGPISIPAASSYAFPGLAAVATYFDASSPYVTGVTFGLTGAVGQNSVQNFDIFVVDTD